MAPNGPDATLTGASAISTCWSQTRVGERPRAGTGTRGAPKRSKPALHLERKRPSRQSSCPAELRAQGPGPGPGPGLVCPSDCLVAAPGSAGACGTRGARVSVPRAIRKRKPLGDGRVEPKLQPDVLCSGHTFLPQARLCFEKCQVNESTGCGAGRGPALPHPTSRVTELSPTAGPPVALHPPVPGGRWSCCGH